MIKIELNKKKLQSGIKVLIKIFYQFFIFERILLNY